MANPEYYRRQSELCLQLALLYEDELMTLRLIGLAKEMRAKAESAGNVTDSEPRGMADFMMGSQGSPDGGRDRD